jgi:hypothetical protein
MATTKKDTAKSAVVEPAAAKAAGLYAELVAMSEQALTQGDHALHATLHAVTVALANAKVAAGQALQNVEDDAAALLEQIKAL